MSRILNIITDVRAVLGDPNGLRYPTDTLISLVNQAIRKISLSANLLKAKSYIKIENNIASYDVSNLVLKFDRIEYLDKNLNVLNSTEMDALDSDWHNTIGADVQNVVIDNLSSGKFKIYPIITNNVYNNVMSNS